MAIKDDMEDVQEAVINELITENGITNTLADGQVTETKIANGAVTAAKLGGDVDLTPADGSITPAKLDRDYLESTGGSVSGNLDVTGNVGIGSGGNLMSIVDAQFRLSGGTLYNGSSWVAKSTEAAIVAHDGSTDGIKFYVNTGLTFEDTFTPTERVRIDSSGSLLVGNTTGASADGGHIFISNGMAFHARDGGVSLVVDRQTTDGDIVEFRKDGSTVGSIGTVGGTPFFANATTGGIRLGTLSGAMVLMPCDETGALEDNFHDIGHSATRWDDIYATNGTIQTSDENEKQDIEALSEAEQRVAVACKGLLRKFRWKSAVEEKGDEARIHFGIIAQDLKAAFEAEGLDAGRYAMFISSTWTDEETGEEKTRLGVRYSELLAFIISAI